jgi:hypothetical protein
MTLPAARSRQLYLEPVFLVGAEHGERSVVPLYSPLVALGWCAYLRQLVLFASDDQSWNLAGPLWRFRAKH